jgi:hypothetical protein
MRRAFASKSKLPHAVVASDAAIPTRQSILTAAVTYANAMRSLMALATS